MITCFYLTIYSFIYESHRNLYSIYRENLISIYIDNVTFFHYATIVLCKFLNILTY